MSGALEPGFLDPPYVDWLDIRAAVVRMLRQMHLPFGQRVFTNLRRPIAESGVPCCVIYTNSEDATLRTQAPKRYARVLELVIELSLGTAPDPDAATDLAQASDGTDDGLGVIARAVLRRFFRDSTLGGLVEGAVYKRGEYEAVDNGGLRYGFQRLFFDVTYTTEAGERPEAGFDALGSVEFSSRSDDPLSPKISDHVVLPS